jgi:hypothetical protein
MIATVNTVNTVIYLKASHPVTYCQCPVSERVMDSPKSAGGSVCRCSFVT